MSSLVSVIIPCYNAENFIGDAIKSVLNQTYPNVEAVVIDDGSTDNSLDVIKAFNVDRVRYHSGINQGAQLARNTGIELAQGEWIKFLDADDLLLHDCIERQLAQVAELPKNKKTIVYGDAIWADRDGNPLKGYPLQPRQPNQNAVAHILQNSPLTSCPLHRTEYVQAINGFDPSTLHAQENDLHLRLVLSGVEFIYYPGAVYKYRQYSNGNRMTDYAYSSKGPFALFNHVEQQKQLITQYVGELSTEVQTALALRLWAYGRVIFREGFKEEANRYFETAKELSPQNCINGKLPYLLLVNLFGATRTESLLNTIKSIIKPSYKRS